MDNTSAVNENMTSTICRLAFRRFVCFGLPLAQFAVACTMKRERSNQFSIAEAFARCRGTKAEQRPIVTSESLDANSVSNSDSEPEKNDEGSSALPASPPHSRCSSPAAEKSSQSETTQGWKNYFFSSRHIGTEPRLFSRQN